MNDNTKGALATAAAFLITGLLFGVSVALFVAPIALVLWVLS